MPCGLLFIFLLASHSSYFLSIAGDRPRERWDVQRTGNHKTHSAVIGRCGCFIRRVRRRRGKSFSVGPQKGRRWGSRECFLGWAEKEARGFKSSGVKRRFRSREGGCDEKGRKREGVGEERRWL